MKIKILQNEIQLNNTIYPLKKIIFKSENDNIIIYNLDFNIIINSRFDFFQDENDNVFNSKEDVINALKQSLQ